MSKRWVTVLLALAMVFACAVGMAEDECPEGGAHSWIKQADPAFEGWYSISCEKCNASCHPLSGENPTHAEDKCPTCGFECDHRMNVGWVICVYCGYECAHEGTIVDGVCVVCDNTFFDFVFVPDNGTEETSKVTLMHNGDRSSLTYTIPECMFTAPEGKEFDKWKRVFDDGSALYYWPEDVFTLPTKDGLTGDITMTAIWKDVVVMYSVSIDFNGGTHEVETSPAVLYSEIESGEEVYLPHPVDELGIVPPSGKAFANYEINGKTVGANENFTVTENVTAKIIWEDDEAETITVTFDANDGTNRFTTQIMEKGVETALEKNTFTREGYEFDRWRTYVSGKGYVYYDDGETVSFDEDAILTAQWDAQECDIAYYPNDGTNDVYTYQVTWYYDEVVILPHPDDMGIVAPENSEFVGWSDGQTTYDAGYEYTFKGDVEFTAVWKSTAIEKVYYTVSFDANGGDGEIAAEQVEFDTAYTLPACTFTGPTATPQFACWLVNGKEMNPGETFTVTANTTVKASWVKSEYTFTFKVNGGNAENGETVTETVKYGATYTLPTADKLGFTAQIGMDFNAWSTDGTNPVASNTVTNVRADMTFLALWKDASYTAAKSIEDVTITEAMKAQGIDTPEKVVSVMEENAAQEGYTEDQVAHVDVVLMLWSDEANGYIEATEENFPEEGIEAVIDIPSEVPGDPEDYDFTLYHMTTTGSKAGQIEEIIPTVRGDKLHARFTGLSPVTIAWKEKITEDVVADMPQTGDPSSLLGWVLLLGASGTGLMMGRKKK